jgi:hypothetical protein
MASYRFLLEVTRVLPQGATLLVRESVVIDTDLRGADAIDEADKLQQLLNRGRRGALRDEQLLAKRRLPPAL